ncbi:MAG: protein translocase subunit SecD [Oscillospiraceae bacterium]|jgi:protein-export membrane protein SecD|nr:protein translocase subunit SecD [Oscillospiraceae bacterium]
MKKVGKPVFFVVALLIVAFVVLSFTGIYWRYGDITSSIVKGAARDIRWGIDIRGGVDVTFSPPEGYDATQEDMIGAEAVMRQRMLLQNITDYELYTDTDRDRIIVRFPWRADEADFDPARAIEELGETAQLTFREGLEVDPATGLPTGVTGENIILTGTDVAHATALYGPITENGASVYFVQLELAESGRQAFSDATQRLQAERGVISIWMDEEMISAPQVNAHITDGMALIEGDFTAESAQDLANKITGGALPFKIVTENYSTISPTLGGGARDAMLMAGVIAFAVISVFMIWQYRVPGAVSIIGLSAQLGFMMAALTGFFPGVPSFTLTLPGIAGVILSIGFGVDANVITAERIKEEIGIGKTIDGSIAAGYKRAFTAIFDGNVTVIIVSIILMGAFGPPGSIFAVLLRPAFFLFGPTTAGTIYSFGYTLFMGVLANFVGIFTCRLMQRSLCRFSPLRKAWLFGGEKA